MTTNRIVYQLILIHKQQCKMRCFNGYKVQWISFQHNKNHFNRIQPDFGVIVILTFDLMLEKKIRCFFHSIRKPNSINTISMIIKLSKLTFFLSFSPFICHCHAVGVFVSVDSLGLFYVCECECVCTVYLLPQLIQCY